MGSTTVSQVISDGSGWGITVYATITWSGSPPVVNISTYSSPSGQSYGWRVKGAYSEGDYGDPYASSTTVSSFEAISGKKYMFQANMPANTKWSDGAAFYPTSDSGSGDSGGGDSGGGDSGGGGSGSSTYYIYINQGAGTDLEVIRTWNNVTGTGTNERLSNGAAVVIKDYFDIKVTALDGYENASYSVTGLTSDTAINAGYDHYGLLSAFNPTVTSKATPKQYALSTSAGAGSKIVVNRISTENSGASIGEINSSTPIYHFDKLQISFETEEGYNLNTHTVASPMGTATVENGYILTVTGSVSIEATAEVKSYKLQLNQGNGSMINVTRTRSPLQGATTNISLVNNAAIYYGDVLRISFTADAGYSILVQKVNGIDAESGDTWVVDDDGIQAVTVTEQMGLARIYNGTSFDSYLVYICDNSNKEFNQYIPYVYNGTSWDICS